MELSLKTNGFEISLDNLMYFSSVEHLARFCQIQFLNKNAEDLSFLKSTLKDDLTASLFLDRNKVFSGLVKVSSDFVGQKPLIYLQVISPIYKYCGKQIGQGKHYIDQKASEIIKALCPDIELEIEKDVQLKDFISFSSESVDQIIARLAVQSNLLIYSSAEGSLKLTEYKYSSRAVGVLEENILTIGAIEKDEEGLEIIGQNCLDDSLSLDEIIKPRLTIAGKNKRCLVVDDVSPSTLNKLYRNKKEIPLKIKDWFDHEGDLLEINEIVRVVRPWIGVDENCLIQSLSLNLSGRGSFSADLVVEAKNV
ncbi:MAG: hypothetical protein ACK5N8_02300 [Alphaproteobacteria bacterium]